MRANLTIRHYRSRMLVGIQELHNLWTEVGHQYLAEIIGLTAYSPDTPERNDRLKYFALGMGGEHGGVSSDATVAATYPAGSDPNATTGSQYNRENPTQPPISTLELPVKKSGGATAYPGAPSDVWLFDSSDGLFMAHDADDISVTVHVPIDTSSGDIVGIWGATHNVAVSEAALLTSAADVNQPYNTVLAYAPFDSILLDGNTQVEFIWTVRFLE